MIQEKTVFFQFSMKMQFYAKIGERMGQDPNVYMTLSVGRIDIWVTPKILVICFFASNLILKYVILFAIR